MEREREINDESGNYPDGSPDRGHGAMPQKGLQSASLSQGSRAISPPGSWHCTYNGDSSHHPGGSRQAAVASSES